MRNLWVIAIALILGLTLTSQIAVLLTGIAQWASPLVLIDLLTNGFYWETAISGCITALLMGCMVGFLKQGFYRYLSLLISSSLLGGMAVFQLGFELYSWIFLGFVQSPSQLIQLALLPYQEPELWNHFLLVEGVAFLLTMLAIMIYLFHWLRPNNKALGNAHFSNGFETKRAGFFERQKQSIIIGKKYGAPLYSNGFEHVLVFAPTGSGKTRSIGIPNLFHYPYSMVCNDVKLTLFKTTSGYRERVLGHQCFCWAPADENRITHCYNPLSLISEDKIQRLTDIQRIAHILMPDNKKSDPIWQQASRKLFKVAVLYLLDTPGRPTTLGEINRLVKQAGFDDWLASVLEETEHLDPEFYRNGYSYLNNHEKTRSSILETFSGYFELFDDPTIDAATARSDFDLRQLRREKITIYIGFTDDDMERLSPLLTLFWQQLISVMIKNIPNPVEEPYPLLCLIDEFSSLGRIERLRRSLKLLREYRVRCVLIMQYIAQTYEQYSHDEAKAFTNIKTKIAFATEDIHDAEYVSKLLGTRTVKVSAGSTSTQTQGYSESRSYNYQAIPLLRPDEVMRLPEDQTLIMRTGHAPVKAAQMIWYLDSEMKHLDYGNTEVPRQTVQHHPFIHRASDKSLMAEALEL
ncbi:type IV secretory system conjugative DNA transfer family protein [Legionella pneumophila serogroup 1]|uniref:type IV secretory system conjugative DNA transfer family protein n=1 Tax=Legionella pneumophila TaxID=446 RepID=UPI00101EAD60|nr:type IV secretory system conjugative DNA transfer family protein [Legionella pneumophila]HAT9682340.1 type IV secretion system DNA-binding domain-containing protein [Legionella pneumophila subsp. pneumophila]MCH9100161.1 type IV secretory system conjugative DNA transfer family protein [Legionella pneumophila serogroup 1]MCH9112296.1 type IV secretory system conjugative DNA transfer family protein [Legionella pneumophila serogroup 1]MDW9159420.1 type IV secretory system conjugative DNA transf